MSKNNTLKKNFFNYIVDKNNCAPCQLKENERDKNFKSCYSKDSLLKISNIWNKNNLKNKIKIENQSRKKLWNQIQKNLNIVCKKDEYCWKKQDFIKKINDINIDMYTFKPDYPKAWMRNENTWLNTYDIYYVMKQYEKANKDFIFLGPIPSDCPIKIKCELSNLDLINMKKNNINKIGIIYNLDVSSGPGTHWVGMYIDNKNNEINYYDSYGNKPTSLINKFIISLVSKYNLNNYSPTIIYNDKRHQFGGSECGMFSINFILERLHGTTMYDISQSDIPDNKMLYLRKLLYKL
jgi:hypothetical protein